MCSTNLMNLMPWYAVLVLMLYSNSVTMRPFHVAVLCEGDTLEIGCKRGYVIDVIRANYGRFSPLICNEKIGADWKGNCESRHRSFEILKNSCGLKRRCNVSASTSLFGDPCPDTVKYLEVYYACISKTTPSPTSRLTTRWIMPSESEDKNKWTSPINTSPRRESSSDAMNTSTETQIGIVEASVMPGCEPVVVRNLSWNWTAAGDVAVQACPHGATGFARYACRKLDDNLATRFPDMPDLSECHSVWLDTFEREVRVNEGNLLIETVAHLGRVTENQPLYGGDMVSVAKIMRTLAQKMSEDIQTYPNPWQPEAKMYDLLGSVAFISSNMLDVSKLPSWQDLSSKDRMRVVSSLLVGLEETSFLLAEAVTRDKVVTLYAKNLILSVEVLDARNVDDEIFPTYSGLENCSLMVNNWLRLERSSLLENNVNGLVRLIYIAFGSLEDVLEAQPYGKKAKKVNSKVLSAYLGKGRHIRLNKSIILCLRHLQTENVSNPTCVSWDYNRDVWSEEGCTLLYTNETHSICRCNRLTNFAILVDVQTPTHSTDQATIMLVIGVLVLAVIIVAWIRVMKFVGKYNVRKDCGSSLIPETEWTYSSDTIPATYALDNSGGLVENHLSGSHIHVNRYNPKSGRNGSVYDMVEVRRLQHFENSVYEEIGQISDSNGKFYVECQSDVSPSVSRLSSIRRCGDYKPLEYANKPVFDCTPARVTPFVISNSVSNCLECNEGEKFPFKMLDNQ